MRSTVRLRILITCGVLVAAGVGGWQLLPSDGDRNDPIGVGTTDAITSLDPAGAYDAGSWAMYSNVFQSLLTFKPGFTTPVPDAAESCKFVGSKLTTYQCTLRDDLSFANGRKVTAEDVKYSFERMLRIKTDVGPKALFPTLKSVTSQDRTVTFHLSGRDATFPLKVATGAGSIVDKDQYPADRLRTGSGVDGSGPYVLKEYKEGESALLEPNPNYKGAVTKTGGPVLVKYYGQSADLANAWKAKDIEVTHRQLPPEFLSNLETKDGTRVTEAESAEIRNLNFNVRPGTPMADKAVRQAVAAVIDRPEIATGAYKGSVEPLYSLIPQGFVGHSTAFYDATPAPSTKKAKKLLKDAGIATPVKFTFGYRADATYGAETAEIKRQLEETGLFEVEAVEVKWTEFQKAYAKGTYDAYTVGWLPDFPDSDSFTAPLVGTENTLHNGFSSKRIDTLISSTQQFSDRSRAASDFKAIQDEVADDVPLVPLWQKKDYVLATEAVAGSQYLTDGTGIWRLWELSWI
ncbi:Oligopeptide binding protein [Streptomyces venezuelae]|uniref:ABC transporter substrate-binding protein n=1 Tax=Streptomyces gardneri TaxID=66892 RepID=UPI0006BDD0A3|nr:ABC transporter substrate-binding protein [Streptomyces gardneri]ALO10563.1 Oligopeptide binding protein [Streptomyces venezuelae]QPK47553.1 peptide-binding protein [Streptomyces gardneri]WRK38993.1 ABC transporter substrate-binding protein [Streptomyces venezuelae]CUM38967.1 oligopeptide binding protein [Streptomyces venezuelae]